MKTSIQDDEVIQSIWDNDLSLLEVWKAYKSAYLVESLTFKEATTRYLDHLRNRKLCDQYIKQMGWVLNEFLGLLDPDSMLPHHTTFAVERGLRKTRNSEYKKGRIASFYQWAYKHNYMGKPVDLTGDKIKTAGKQIGTLENDEVEALIKACPEELQGHLWLRLCMGLRVSEASQVEELSQRDGYLIVGANAAKTRTRRVIKMLPRHKRWWSCVSPLKSLRERFEKVRSDAGIEKWPNNAMRHTAASHWLNYYQDESKAALHLGNSPTMLHRHYKALVTEKESEKFFKLWK